MNFGFALGFKRLTFGRHLRLHLQWLFDARAIVLVLIFASLPPPFFSALPFIILTTFHFQFLLLFQPFQRLNAFISLSSD